MTDLFVTKIDESFMKIQGEPHIIEELSEHFTFYAKNYQHSPKFKRGGWDGRIRLFKKRGYLLPLGLKHQFDTWCKEEGWTNDIEWPLNALSPFGWDKYIQKLVKVPDFIKMRDDQINLFWRMKEAHRGVVLSPTGSGKSWLIYLRCKEVSTGRTLIVCPTTNLVNQMYNDFAAYGWEVTKKCVRVWEGVDPLEQDFPCVISTWQSLIPLLETCPEYFQLFDQIIVDECHGAAADSLVSIVQACTTAPYKFGFTGTLDDLPVHLMTLEGLFGPIINGPTTKELIDKKVLADVTINCIILEYPDDERDKMKRATYQDEVDFLTAHEGRSRYVQNLVGNLKGSTFALCRLIDKHAKLLYHNLVASADGVGLGRFMLVIGDTKVEDREIARLQADLMDDSIVVASYGVFSGGVNVPNLRNVVFASPYKSKIKVLQSIGRALRRPDGKTHADIYDVVDDLTVAKGGYVNHSMKHFLMRIKYYNQQKLPYKITRIKVESWQNPKPMLTTLT